VASANVNRMHQNKMLHLGVEINQAWIEGLVDIGASMSASMVRKLDIMHLVTSHETYKTTFEMVTQALQRITKFLVRVRGIIC